MAFTAVMRSDGKRTAVEREIRQLYWDHYAARLSSFPDTLVTELGPSGNVECSAGIYFGCQGLFSECYLDLPVERILSGRFGRVVRRNRVVEVSNLAATTPGQSLPFVRRVIEFADMAGAEWAIFTATRALRALLQRGGINMIELARAERRRVKNPNDWGNYYDHDPRVMAVSHAMAFANMPLKPASGPLGLVTNA
jgi:hypothetical protein